MKNAENGIFDAQVFKFLDELKANNNRNWFQKNKQRYDDVILIPALNFISTIGEKLPQVSTNFTATPKRIGGSIMRVYRDTRFSKDKTPYKTNIGIQFRHRMAKDVHTPGYYLHIASDDCFIGIGTWHPPSDALLKIREHIVEFPEKWIAARDDKPFRKEFELSGEKLKTVPRGFDKDHKLINDLRWKDFIAFKNITKLEVVSGNLTNRTIELFKTAKPYMNFLCDAIGIPF